MMHAVLALVLREMLRFVRQPSRVVATVGTPALIWLFLASGFAGSFDMPGGDGGGSYAEFAIPGMATMVVLFSTIFASISLIQDRQSGLLQSVIVSPCSSGAIVASKVLAGSALASAQAAVVLGLGFVIGESPGAFEFALSIVAVIASAVMLTSLGLTLAWWVNSSSGFHGVMNLILMPMWLLSGAIFPVDGASAWLRVFTLANPLHHANEAIGGSTDALHWGVTIGFAAVCFAAACAVIRTRPSSMSQRAIA